MLDERDERPHLAPAGTDPAETWTFVGRIADPALWVTVRLTWRPTARVAWYAATLLRPPEAPVLVLDDDVPLAVPSPSIEFRNAGLWAMHVCETPFDHWTIGLEAYGVAVDDLRTAVDRPWGDRTGLGLDLEWEATGAVQATGSRSYRVPAHVSGEVLVGLDEHPAVEGTGWWTHAWGPGEWPDGRAWLVDLVDAVTAG